MSGIDRRMILRGGLALGCSAAASPLFAPMAFANAPWDNRLVVIVLRGAMDGLDAVRPTGDPALARLRPTIAGRAERGAIDAGLFSLHPALDRLAPMWSRGQLGAVHAVSTPYRDQRSHFDGQDLLEAGLPGAPGRDGWLNRMLQTVPGLSAETAYAIGREEMLILSGRAAARRWSPEARLGLTPQGRRLLELVTHEDPLFRDALDGAMDIVDLLAADEEEAVELTGPDGAPLRGEHVRQAAFAAARLRNESRIASFSVNGWDTHERQQVGLGRALDRLSETLLALEAGLGPVWDKTAVLCMTEFGRTAAENGTAGTDHGTGGAMLFAGGALRGGRVLGDWPGLSEADLYDRRDLMPTRDLRAHAGWVMRGLFGLDRSVIEGSIFPGLDLGGDPGLVG